MADAYTVALTLLSARELSESQLRTRLKRRKLDADDIEAALSRLKADRTLNDRRVATAIARMESTIKHRGRARVIQKIRQAGIDGDIAQDAVSEVFSEEVDEQALLERAFERRLRGKSPRDLDDKGRARIVRGLTAQGFPIDAVLKRLKAER
ncbi:MAG TPA: regulatory protein RecX [Vicinamibacterales bacterium]|nr:regulatory protein RecX [Vicinamibacterales bacterium]